MVYYILLTLTNITKSIQRNVDGLDELYGWFPFNVNTNKLVFNLLNSQQMIPAVLLTYANLSLDHMFIGFLIQSKYQLTVLERRISKIGVARCIKDHQAVSRVVVQFF